MDRIFGRVAEIRNDILHGGATRGLRIDIPDGIMASRADIGMGLQDIRPVQDIMTVGAGPGINLA